MRRILASCTVAIALIAAATAYAVVTNTYTAVTKIAPSKAGTKKAPAAVSVTVDYTAQGSTGNRTAPLTDIKNTWYGLQTNGKLFPTCTAQQIAAAQTDAGCPPKSKIGTGNLYALIGPSADTSTTTSPGTPCSANIDVFNAGQGKFVFELAPVANKCPVPTLPPLTATATVSHGNLILDAPIPDAISHPYTGVDGSLVTEHILYKNVVTKVKGKKRAFFESIGCLKGKRPYKTSFTANGLTVVVPGKPLKCSK
jgi:hypothetical protein